jgi:hypothetical protein
VSYNLTMERHLIFVSSFSTALKLEPSNSLRFGLLDRLREGPRPEEGDMVRDWCHRYWDHLFCTLHKPVPQDVPILVAAAKLRGAEFVRDL